MNAHLPFDHSGTEGTEMKPVLPLLCVLCASVVETPL